MNQVDIPRLCAVVDAQGTGRKPVLHIRPLGVTQARMVGRRFHTSSLQCGGGSLRSSANDAPREAPAPKTTSVFRSGQPKAGISMARYD